MFFRGNGSPGHPLWFHSGQSPHRWETLFEFGSIFALKSSSQGANLGAIVQDVVSTRLDFVGFIGSPGIHQILAKFCSKTVGQQIIINKAHKIIKILDSKKHERTKIKIVLNIE